MISLNSCDSIEYTGDPKVLEQVGFQVNKTVKDDTWEILAPGGYFQMEGGLMHSIDIKSIYGVGGNAPFMASVYRNEYRFQPSLAGVNEYNGSQQDKVLQYFIGNYIKDFVFWFFRKRGDYSDLSKDVQNTIDTISPENADDYMRNLKYLILKNKQDIPVNMLQKFFDVLEEGSSNQNFPDIDTIFIELLERITNNLLEEGLSDEGVFLLKYFKMFLMVRKTDIDPWRIEDKLWNHI